MHRDVFNFSVLNRVCTVERVWTPVTCVNPFPFQVDPILADNLCMVVMIFFQIDDFPELLFQVVSSKNIISFKIKTKKIQTDCIHAYISNLSLGEAVSLVLLFEGLPDCLWSFRLELRLTWLIHLWSWWKRVFSTPSWKLWDLKRSESIGITVSRQKFWPHKI